MSDTFPPRLHIVFAKEKPLAVVFRRGPSKEVCTFLWNRDKNTFQLGQWLKGRIYERRTDISPDGKYLIYFAMNGKWDSETKGSWTAVSKVPWLKALDLYAKGDCWEGGGLFLSNKEYWLNDRYLSKENTLKKTSQFKQNEKFKFEEIFGAECTGIYYPKLMRDGWELKRREEKDKWNSCTVFEKRATKKWLLRKIAHEQVGSPKGKGCYWDEHELVNEITGEKFIHSDWEWAEVDKETIYWASKGCLYSLCIQSRSKLSEPKMLHDFNDYKFEEIQAPY